MSASDPPNPLHPQDLKAWQQAIAEANRYNIFCRCRQCEWEWIASDSVPCRCGSVDVEYICCWQFPDD